MTRQQHQRQSRESPTLLRSGTRLSALIPLLILALAGVASGVTLLSETKNHSHNHSRHEKTYQIASSINFAEVESELGADLQRQVLRQIEAGGKADPLILAQLEAISHAERLNKTMTAVTAIQTFPVVVERNVDEIFSDGYWKVVCDRLRQSTSVADLAYFIQLDNSYQLFDGLLEDSDKLEKLLGMCGQKNMDAKSDLLMSMDMKQLVPDPTWTYRKPKDVVAINDRMSKDLSLFFTVSDVRALFNYEAPVYARICKLLSGGFAGYQADDFNDNLALLIGLQSVLTELTVFNYLTEDQTARKLLYKVCENSVDESEKTVSELVLDTDSNPAESESQDSEDKKQESVAAEVPAKQEKNKAFKVLFKSFADMDKIFN